MSDSDSPPRSPFAPLSLSCGESVGSSGSQNPGSRPRDHRSQVPCRSQGSLTRNGAQHTCGLPHLSLHGFGLPRTTSEVFYTSHRDSVKTIHNPPGPLYGTLDSKSQYVHPFWGKAVMAACLISRQPLWDKLKSQRIWNRGAPIPNPLTF